MNIPTDIYLFKVNKEALEKVQNLFKVNNKNTKTTSVDFNKQGYCCI